MDNYLAYFLYLAKIADLIWARIILVNTYDKLSSIPSDKSNLDVLVYSSYPVQDFSCLQAYFFFAHFLEHLCNFCHFILRKHWLELLDDFWQDRIVFWIIFYQFRYCIFIIFLIIRVFFIINFMKVYSLKDMRINFLDSKKVIDSEKTKLGYL